MLTGIIALELRPQDHLIGVKITSGDNDIVLVASTGKSIRFREEDVRPMGRNATGVRGIKVAEAHRVISLISIAPDDKYNMIEFRSDIYTRH